MTSVASFMRLAELVPPPENPVHAYGDWKRFVSVNGFIPPDDYRMLIREYGTGTFGRWLHLIDTFDPALPFMSKAEIECKALVDRRREPGSPGWPIWPEPGGLLPWAVTADGDHIGWRTEGRPAEWTTLLWTRNGKGSRQYDTGAIGFLVGLVECSLGDPEFDRRETNPFFVEGEPFFEPADD